MFALEYIVHTVSDKIAELEEFSIGDGLLVAKKVEYPDICNQYEITYRGFYVEMVIARICLELCRDCGADHFPNADISIQRYMREIGLYGAKLAIEDIWQGISFN